jgi:hypothetical protein
MVAMVGYKKAAGVRKLIKPSVPGFPAAVGPVDRRRQASPLIPSRQSVSSMLSCCPLSAGSMTGGWPTKDGKQR